MKLLGRNLKQCLTHVALLKKQLNFKTKKQKIYVRLWHIVLSISNVTFSKGLERHILKYTPLAQAAYAYENHTVAERFT